MSSIKVRQRHPRNGGRTGRAVILAPLAAFLLLLLPGCGGGPGGSGALNDMLKMLPDDSSGMVYVDTAEIFDDDDLRDMQRALESSWSSVSDLEDDFDLDIDDLEYVAAGSADDGRIVLLGGVDDPDDLRDELDDQDYDDDEIEGEEVWINEDRLWEAFAFLDGAVLITRYEDDMEDVLERWKEGDDSCHDEVGDIASKLPSGITWSIFDCGADYMSGTSLEKESDDEVKIHRVRLFDDEDDAEDALDDIEDDIDDDDLPRGCDDAKADRDDDIVQFEMVCDTDDGVDLFQSQILNLFF